MVAPNICVSKVDNSWLSCLHSQLLGLQGSAAMLGISSVAAASLEARVRTGSLFPQKRVAWVWSSQNTCLILLASHRKPFFSRRSTASEVTALHSRILYQEHVLIQTSINTLNQSLSSLLNMYSMRKQSMKKISLDQKWYFHKLVNCPSSCELCNQGFRAFWVIPLPLIVDLKWVSFTVEWEDGLPFLCSTALPECIPSPPLSLTFSFKPIVHGQLDTGKV